jgi:type IV pilus assembly protein PilY1
MPRPSVFVVTPGSVKGVAMSIRILDFVKYFACAGVLTAAIGGGPKAVADDAELYQTASYELGPDYYANVLFIIDTSGSMNSIVSDGKTRLDVVREVTQQFLNELEYVNVGLMRFDSGYSLPDWTYIQGGGMVVSAVEDIGVSRGNVIAQLNNFVASGNTPLSETLYEAGQYLRGDDVYFGLDTFAGLSWFPPWIEFMFPSVPASRDGDTYISPLAECRKTHIVLLTDGLPVQDDETEPLVTAWPGFPEACTDNPDVSSGDCLDDIAAYLYENDLYGDETDGFQNVITHTIGFFQDNSLLAETAARGGGKYYLANDAESLLETLESIFVDVNEMGTTFTSPGVSVNAFDRTTHLDQLYYSVFQATGRASWSGNLKRYRLGESSGGALVVLDAQGAEAVDQTSGFFREDSKSWWSAEADGFSVEAGGAAGQLTKYRNTLTELGGAIAALTSDNGDLVDYLVGLFPQGTLDAAISAGISEVFDSGNGDGIDLDDAVSQIEVMLDWASGSDIKDSDGDGDLYEARRRMADPMHSRPLVVTYGSGEEEPEAAVFVGANDGFLHAFRGETGEELSAFMPFELLPRLPDWFANRETAQRLYGVDGPITAWVKDGGDGQVDAGDSVYLYFGLRRGGAHYYAMDYTDPRAPRLLWKLSNTMPGFSQLGQSWSPPTRTRVKTGVYGAAMERDVLIFGAGYDERQDDYSAWAPDSRGNAIYMVDAYTGELVWSGSAANTQDTVEARYFADMTNAITGQVRVLDLDDDSFADRLYAADLGGRVWRFDVHNPDAEGESFSVTGGVLASLGGAESAAASSNRRFYYAPDIALGAADGRNFFNITIASGYRAHPKDVALQDYFYVLRDYYPFSELGLGETGEAEYVDRYGYVHDDLADLSLLQSDPDTLVAGYRMALTSAAGEKVLSETRIFQNKATFTSFLPQNELTRGCFAALGSGQLYSIHLGSGSVAREDLDKPGIPPEVVYVFTEDEGTGYVPPTCFGDDCGESGGGESGEGGEGDGEGDGDEDRPVAAGREIGCVVGPEQCDASAREVPVKTWWRQLNTDE